MKCVAKPVHINIKYGPVYLLRSTDINSTKSGARMTVQGVKVRSKETLSIECFEYKVLTRHERAQLREAMSGKISLVMSRIRLT